ncbi:MAG: hypothetical protein RhofKO_14340 [Rhodothermales bacterium]
MITRDFLMRQLHQFVQALARALFAKAQHNYDDARTILNVALATLPGGASPEGISELAAGLRDGSLPADEQVLTLADVLYEDAKLAETLGQYDEADARYAQALLVYEAIQARGAAILPLHFLDRLDEIRGYVSP